MRAEDVGVLRIEDRRLDRLAEDGVWVVNEVGVQRVVASDEHGERSLTRTPGTSGLLPQRRTGARASRRAGPRRDRDTSMPSSSALVAATARQIAPIAVGAPAAAVPPAGSRAR